MESSNSSRKLWESRPLVWGSAFLILILLSFVLFFWAREPDSEIRSTGLPPIGPDTVVYHYRFGGQVLTHYLNGVMVLTEYRRPEAVDQVVFSLKDGRNYVLNADILVNYTLSSNSTIEKREVLNQLYNHYDPYLQAKKQQWHHDWVDEQYLKYVGRLPDDDEWLVAFNELTRGVEHYQMERWIQYSPPAIRRFVEIRFSTLAGRVPTEDEALTLIEQLTRGAVYEDVDAEIITYVLKLR